MLVSIEMKSEPLNSLQESVFLRILISPAHGVSATSESVLNTTVQINLIGDLLLRQDFFGFQSFLPRQLDVDLCGSDGKWIGDFLDFLYFHEARVGDVAGVEALCVQVANDVSSTKTVTGGAN